MGHPRQKVEKTDLLTSALALCKTGDWSKANVSKMTHDPSPDLLQLASTVLKDAFHQSVDSAQKLRNVETLLQCIYKGDYIFENTYRPETLFSSLFKEPNGTSWRTDLSSLERHALASLFSFGISKNRAVFDFAWGFRTDSDYTYTSLIEFIKENYFPSSEITSPTLPRNKICAKILESGFSRNLSPKNLSAFLNVFSDDFCPDLADKRLNAKRENKIGLLYNDIKDENEILQALKAMVPIEFTSGKEIIPYARDVRHFRGGLFFQHIKTDGILQAVLTFISPTPQESIAYTVWSRSRNSVPLNIKMSDLKGVSILTLLNELTNYVAAADCWNPKDPEFRMKTNKNYFKKIYESLPKEDRAQFVGQVANEYRAQINSNPDKKSEVKEEGAALLNSLHWWNPKYLDDAIKKLKSE